MDSLVENNVDAVWGELYQKKKTERNVGAHGCAHFFRSGVT
jgi:hypothetical protein